MRIEELPGDSDGGGGGEGVEELPQLCREVCGASAGAGGVVMRAAVDAKRAAVGVGARMLFYPTLCYNVVRNRLEAHFHWWDQVDEVENFSSPFDRCCCGCFWCSISFVDLLFGRCWISSLLCVGIVFVLECG